MVIFLYVVLSDVIEVFLGKFGNLYLFFLVVNVNCILLFFFFEFLIFIVYVFFGRFVRVNFL